MRIHFIGIGGIGVSALAQYYLEQGAEVSGSDLVSSEITDLLKKKDAKIIIGKQKAENIPQNADLIIYSPAVEESNPELKQARKFQVSGFKFKIKSYPEALGDLTKKRFTIAVSGTHGKSTTTAMLGLLLTKAGLDPTVIVGTKLKEFGDSNCRVGKSQYLVIEADEHFASFLNYWPKIIVLTTLEEDHLDYYKNLKNLINTFKEYIGHLSKEGILVANRDDKNILRMLNPKSQIPNSKQITNSKFKIPKTIYYSLKQKEARILKNILKVPGEHNVSNALAALAVARILKISDKVSFKALSEYKGAWRRFEIKQKKINKKQITIISDYGHHPTEIKVTLKAAREKYGNPTSPRLRGARKIWCIYQPHQYQRTFYLFKDFVKVFRQAPVDNLIITDIYSVAGRESAAIKKKVNSKKLVKKISKENVVYLPKNKIKNYLKENLRSGDVLIIMGAGDIYDLEKELFK